MNVDIIAEQYQAVRDLQKDVNQLVNTISSHQEEAPLRAFNLVKMQVEERLKEMKLQQQDNMIESAAQQIDKCVKELEDLQANALPLLLEVAEAETAIQNQCQQPELNDSSGDESEDNNGDDELDKLLTAAATQNTRKETKPATQEEIRFKKFMDKVEQARQGKSDADLLKERVSIVKKQCMKIAKNEQGLLQYQYQATPFTNEELCNALRLIMLGESGSGKSTLMNTLLNVVTGVEFGDPFRFILIPESIDKGQHQSQTTLITEYRINAHNGYPPIILIDTPGFGDTQGIERDQQIFKDLSKFLQNFTHLHAVCMVAKSSVNRVSVYQNYIFDSVFNLFGKDVIENFICLLTFCDVGQPQILQSLQSDTCDIKQHIPNIQPPWYLKLNNMGMFCRNTFQHEEEQDRYFNKQHFDMCKSGFDRFFAKFCNLKPKTLALTKQQLGLKDDLEFYIESMNKLVLECETHERNVEQLIESIENNKDRVDAHKDFMIEQDDIQITKTPLPGNQNTTTCLACQRTCHDNCGYSNDSDKRSCVAMGSNGYCKHCSCFWNQHKNIPYQFQVTNVKKKVRSEDMFQKYKVASDEKNRAEALLKQATEEQMLASLQCLEYRESISNALRKLKTIALKKVDSTSTIEYIQMQIKVLEEQKPPNYIRRVAQLQDHQKKYENLQKLIKKEKGSMKDIFGAYHCFKNGQQVQKSSLWEKTRKLYQRFF